MDINEKTMVKLANSIRELMQDRPLSKISVKDIVENCELTRQTFYRYFKDKYDLVNWYFEKLAQQSFKQLGVSCTLREGLIKKFELIKADRRFFFEAFMADDQNSLFEYDMQCIYEFYEGIIAKKCGGTIEDDVRFLLRMYCKGSIDMTFEWVKTGMTLTEEQFSDLLIEAMPEKLKQYLLVY